MCVHVYIMCMHKLTYLIKTITMYLNLNNYMIGHFEENNIDVSINNGNMILDNIDLKTLLAKMASSNNVGKLIAQNKYIVT